MDKKNNNKLIISMTDLEDFADKLIEFGKAKDNQWLQDMGKGLKVFFFNVDLPLKQEFKDFFEGYVFYIEK
jgi:hypothetical protein